MTPVLLNSASRVKGVPTMPQPDGSSVSHSAMEAFIAALRRQSLRTGLIASAFACAIWVASGSTALSDACKPSRPRPPVILKDMGACSFDTQTLSFLGDPVEQAKCLVRGMDVTRNLKSRLDSLPPALASRVGSDNSLPAREVLSAYLSKRNMEWDFAANL
jgi:hypothetical protein